jgi:hypothetical protein
MDWSSNAYDGTGSGSGLDFSWVNSDPTPFVDPAKNTDMSNNALSAFSTAAGILGKVAIADINANSRYPSYGTYGVPGQYRTQTAGLQISPMLLLLIVGAFFMAKE